MSRSGLVLEPVSCELHWKNPEANLHMIRETVETRLRDGSGVLPADRVFVFPELTLTGFVTEDPQSVALNRDSEWVQGVMAVAKKTGTSIVFGFPEKQAHLPRPVNTLMFVDSEGEVLCDYQKMHLFTGGSPPESETYQPGDAGALVNYRGWKIGFGICFDLRFPALFQAYAQEGADLVIVPACWVGGPGKSHQLQTLSAAHAISGQYYLLVVNRSGRDPAFHFEGEGFVYSPKGEKLSAQNSKTGVPIEENGLIDGRKLSVRASDHSGYPVLIY